MECYFKSESCGIHKRSRQAQGILVKDMDTTCKNYLVSAKLLHSYDKDPHISEKYLIESRCNVTFNADHYLCAYHRCIYGYYWKPPKHCLFPDHQKSTGKQGVSRHATLEQSSYLSSLYEKKFPLGGTLCIKHMKHVNSLMSGKETNVFNLDISVGSLYELPLSEKLSSDQMDESDKKRKDLSNTLDLSPIWGVKRKNIEDLAESSLRQIKCKYTKAKMNLKETFANSVAPGQSDILKEYLSQSDEDEPVISKELQTMIDLYKNSDKVCQTIILSMVDKSKEELISLFNCTRYRIDQARLLKKQSDSLNIPKVVKHSRLKMDQLKCEHFLDFIFSSGMLMDVAYGTTNIKFDSGDVQTLPHAVLTVRFKHAISCYIEMCRNASFQPLSESSLYRILRSLKPSQRKSLSGLDDIMADGLNAFDTLQAIASNYINPNKYILETLESSKRYLKIGYLQNCSIQNETLSHCIAHALSDPENENLSKKCYSDSCHHSMCKKCDLLFETINNILLIIPTIENANKEDLLYDANVAKNQIFKWLQHLIRHAQQDKAKRDCLENLSTQTGLLIRDYCQKVLPMAFREGQCNYFGKKGMTLHADVLLLKSNDLIYKQTYFSAAYRSDQGIADSLAIATLVIDQISTDFPHLKELFCKSDNAGSYHGNFYAQSLYQICKAHGITLLRLDYNEPQKGKDQCDREAALARNALRNYVDQGNNIQSAEDIFTALTSSKLRSTKVCVVDFNKKIMELSGKKMPGIDKYHSYQFTAQGMKAWRYYQIGAGYVISFDSNLSFKPGLQVKLPFTQCIDCTLSQSKKGVRKDRQICNLLFCRDTNCTMSFATFEDLEAHMTQGIHQIPMVKSGMDYVKKSFTKRMIGAANSHESLTSTPSKTTSNIDISLPFYQEGWALPVRSSFRFKDNQKLFLFKLFTEGEKTGNKVSPEAAHQEMRKCFQPEDYCTSKQIRSLFSRWSIQKRNGTLKEKELLERDDPCIEGSSNKDTTSVVNDLAQKLCSYAYDVNDWVALAFGKTWYPGEVKSVTDDEIEVLCMERIGRALNSFAWPDNEDLGWYSINDILCTIDPPIPETRRAFVLSGEDIMKVNEMMLQH